MTFGTGVRGREDFICHAHSCSLYFHAQPCSQYLHAHFRHLAIWKPFLPFPAVFVTFCCSILKLQVTFVTGDSEMPSSMPNFAASTSMVPICAILPSVDPFCPFWPSLLFLLLKIETVSHFCNRRQRDAIFHAQFCTSMYLHDAHFCHLAIWKPFLSILASPMPILAVSTTDIS